MATARLNDHGDGTSQG
jgi:hypothetical protein